MPHPSFWLARRFAFVEDYRAALLLDAFRWPETAPRTSAPVDFAALLRRPSFF